jgi:hypothetical protein
MAAMFQGIHGGDHRQVHDFIHLRPPLQDMYRLGHPDEDRSDGLGATEAVEHTFAALRSRAKG